MVRHIEIDVTVVRSKLAQVRKSAARLPCDLVFDDLVEDAFTHVSKLQSQLRCNSGSPGWNKWTWPALSDTGSYMQDMSGLGKVRVLTS